MHDNRPFYPVTPWHGFLFLNAYDTLANIIIITIICLIDTPSPLKFVISVKAFLYIFLKHEKS